MAGHIYRTVTHKSVQTVVPLYKALVRPHLEYCSLVWSPYLKKDILSIEKVQRRVTKMIPSISALTYEERLKRTGLISQRKRRLRADLLEVFKILKGFVKVDPATHFSMSDRRSRGHTLKLEKPRARLELRRHFFSNRVIDAWNSLPGHMVQATSTNMWPSDNLKDGLTGKSQCVCRTVPWPLFFKIGIRMLSPLPRHCLTFHGSETPVHSL